MQGMFNGAAVFNQFVGGWNTQAVTHSTDMFLGTCASGLEAWQLKHYASYCENPGGTCKIYSCLDSPTTTTTNTTTASTSTSTTKRRPTTTTTTKKKATAAAIT